MSSTAENSEFRMDRSHMVQFGSFEEAEKIDLANVLSIAERLHAIEFFRMQWIDMNGLNSKMDRTYFEYR